MTNRKMRAVHYILSLVLGRLSENVLQDGQVFWDMGYGVVSIHG